MNIPPPISAITARQFCQLGYFFILTDFAACTHLRGSITDQWENLTALKTKSPQHFNTSLPTGKQNSVYFIYFGCPVWFCVTQHPEKSLSQSYLLNSGFTKSLNSHIQTQLLEIYGPNLTLLPAKQFPFSKIPVHKWKIQYIHADYYFWITYSEGPWRRDLLFYVKDQNGGNYS